MAPSEWPRWWRGVERVETLREGDANGVGSIRRSKSVPAASSKVSDAGA
jgi:hypothetical protein